MTYFALVWQSELIFCAIVCDRGPPKFLEKFTFIDPLPGPLMANAAECCIALSFVVKSSDNSDQLYDKQYHH